MDALSDVLRVVRVSRAVFVRAECSSPWAIGSPPPERRDPFLALHAECVAILGFVVEGQCIVETAQRLATNLASGDVILFPQGSAHTMRSADAAARPRVDAVFPRASHEVLQEVSCGGGGTRSSIFCACLTCDARFGTLLRALPTAMVARCADGYGALEALDPRQHLPSTVPQSSGTWLGTTLKFTINEARNGRPGNAAMLGRLTELMFLQMLREYLPHLPPHQDGWMTAMQDARVGNAIRQIHAHPARNWTVTGLAQHVGLSRSALALHFTALVGETPMRYLANWRIQLARQLLIDGGRSVQEVAAAVGYESEAAFNRAFKRATGAPPAAWRRAVAGAGRLSGRGRRALTAGG